MKIAVIGGGPAGLSAAIELAAGGQEVTLFEKAGVGENIICAEGFFDFFGTHKLELPEALKITRLILEDKDTYNVPLPSSCNFLTFDRSSWQKDLKRFAIQYGAKVVERTTIRRNDIPELSRTHDHVIDATGVKGLTHAFFPRKEVQRYRAFLMPTIQYTLRGDFSHFHATIKALILNDPPGYYWFFPRLEDGKAIKANAGLGYLTKSKKLPNLKTLLGSILAKEGLAGAEITACKASPIPARRMRSYRSGNLILAGDALGLCSPLHGGGIDTAYYSGRAVARSILQNDFRNYEMFLKQTDRRFFKERIFVKLWDFFGSHRVLSRLRNKDLFSDIHGNLPLSGAWLNKALLRMIF